MSGNLVSIFDVAPQTRPTVTGFLTSAETNIELIPLSVCIAEIDREVRKPALSDAEENKSIRTHTAKTILLNHKRSRCRSSFQNVPDHSLEQAIWRSVHRQILPFCIHGSVPAPNDYQRQGEFTPLLHANSLPCVQMHQVVMTIVPILGESEFVSIMSNPSDTKITKWPFP